MGSGDVGYAGLEVGWGWACLGLVRWSNLRKKDQVIWNVLAWLVIGWFGRLSVMKRGGTQLARAGVWGRVVQGGLR